MREKKLLVFQENLHGCPALSTQGKSVQGCLGEGGDPLCDAKKFHDFAEVSMQRALPAESVEISFKASRDKFVKTFHHLDAGVVGRWNEWRHGWSQAEECAGRFLMVQV